MNHIFNEEAFNHISFFSGEGGFDLAAEWMGWNNVAHCENNTFCQNILKYYWPNAKSFTDIKTFDGIPYRGKIDIITGGFPCQPFSTAGERKGSNDDRFLWPEYIRAAREIEAPWFVGENVPGITSIENGLVFGQVCADLEAAGYQVWAFNIPAVAKNADHQRKRIWIVGYSAENRKRRQKYVANTKGKRLEIREGRENFIEAKSFLGSQRSSSSIDAANSESERLREARRDFQRSTQRLAGYVKQSNATNPGGLGLPRSEKAGNVCENRPEPDAQQTRRCDRSSSFPSNAGGSGSPGQGRVGAALDPKEGRDWKKYRAINDTQPKEHWYEAATRLCIVDDGFPGKLDAITVSKWRQESLKAAGNSIVPQVAFEIFDAVDTYEILY